MCIRDRSKVLKQSAWLNIALGITCTFGFPTTVMLSEEIANGCLLYTSRCV